MGSEEGLTAACVGVQATGALPIGSRAQYLDKLQVERERGITVKVNAARVGWADSDDA